MAHSRAELAVVASRSVERARAFAHDFGIEQAVSEAELLEDKTIDAVYIANDSVRHAASSIAALRAGKAVLCEKPFAVSLAEAQEVASVAHETGALLMEAISTPFLPAFRHAIDAAQNGRLGQAKHFYADFGFPVTPTSEPKLFAAGGGVLLDRAVYLVALALELFGPAEKIAASIEYDHAGVDVAAVIQLDHSAGNYSQLAASFNSLLSNHAKISCDRGIISLDAPLLKAESVRVSAMRPLGTSSTGHGGFKAQIARWPFLRRAAAVAKRPFAMQKPYGRTHYEPQFEHFVELIRKGMRESSILPLTTSLEIQRILAAARA